MSQYYTVSETDDQTTSTTTIETSKTVQVYTTSATSPTTDSSTGETISLPADTLQLMGMAASLPTSNLFVNYPHTMWAKDADGNNILQIKAEADDHDILSQATIKQEHLRGGDLDDGTVVTTISLNSGQTIVMGSKSGQDGIRPHCCDICQKSFAKREHLTKHLRIHKSDNKRYSCEYCHKAFRDRYELVRHTRRHTGDFPFRCGDCNKGFMRHERYMTHLRWHSGERPYQCQMCEKSFRDRSELNRHSRRHTGDLPYKCEVCNKGFLRRERYVTHVRIHTGEKPFVCAVCSRGYRDKRELKKHQASHNHSGQSDPIPGTSLVVSGSPTTSTNTSGIIMNNNNSSSNNIITKTIIVQQPQQHQQQQQQQHQQQQQQQQHQQQQQQQHVVTSPNTVHLPSQPVPKELLNINGHQGQVQQQIHEPLNPANIPLPPSVASALQHINEKVTARQNKQKALAEAAAARQAALVAAKQEPLSHINVQPSPSNSPSSSPNSSPVFYYLMPGSVPYSLSSDGGATVQVKTADGQIATAQLITVPSSALQSLVGSTNLNSLQSWVIDGSSTATAVSRGSM